MKTIDIYELSDCESIETPALVYYRDILIENIQHAIVIAEGATRLWAHVKTHKIREMVKLQMDMGIQRFKCATIAEAEMLSSVGALDVLLAYPLIGPNIERFINLQQEYPDTTLWAIADDFGQLEKLAAMASATGLSIPVLLDVNYGMNRTGIPIGPAVAVLYQEALSLRGITMRGFHCYDGHHNDSDIAKRMERVRQKNQEMFAIADTIVYGTEAEKPIFVMGGTPSFPCHAPLKEVYLSPGTAFVYDYGYQRSLPDLPFVPAAALITRVVSHPSPQMFTLDLGYKGIAADPAGVRGVILGMEDSRPVFQSEEHWVFTCDDNKTIPPIGSILYVIPTHICPTTALYNAVLVAEGGKIIDHWDVAARNRHLVF